MSRGLIVALGLGATSALALYTLRTGSYGAVILAYLAPLPLFYAGLTLGVSHAAVATVIAGLGVLALSPTAVPSFLISTALPVLILTHHALLRRTRADGEVEWYPPGRLLAWLSGLTVAGFLGAVAWTIDQDGGLPGFIAPLLMRTMTILPPLTSDSISSPELVEVMAQIMPAVFGVVWFIVTLANGVLAQGLALRTGRNIRPGTALGRLTLPNSLGVALGLSAVAGALLEGYSSYVATTVAVILAAPFFLQGLAVVHALVERVAARGLILAGFYLLLVLSGVMALPITALGVVEQWIGLRGRRFAAQRKED